MHESKGGFMSTVSRRDFVKLALAFGAEAAWCNPFAYASTTKWTERRDLFPEGVASGDPDSNSVILWTRRAPSPDPVTKLTLEVAEDAAFKKVVGTHSVALSPTADGTCRVLAGGLKPRHVYWYRFTDPAGNGSRIGRTMTAPADHDTTPATFVFVSCQNANFGPLNAYRRMIYEDEKDPKIEFVLHLGDFIYELVWYPEDRAKYMDRTVRDIVRYATGEKIRDFHVPANVDDYRAIYKAYLHNKDLQDARARWPFVTMWDNHEFSWLGWQGMQVFDGKTRPAQTLKVAANQVLWEFQPSRMLKSSGPSLESFDPPKVQNVEVTKFDEHGLGDEPNNLAAINSLQGYRAVRWGANLEVIITDERSYRWMDPEDHPELNVLFSSDFPFYPEEILKILDGGHDYNDGHPPDTLRFGKAEAPNVRKTERPQTLLGAKQLDWFLNTLRDSKATWKIWGSTMATLDQRADPDNLPAGLTPTPWPGGFANFGGDDVCGAYQERAKIYDFVRDHGITGFASVCGDRHSFWAGLAAKALPPEKFEPIGLAFVVGSINTPGPLEGYENSKKLPSTPLGPLFLARGPEDKKLQPTINMLLMHGVKSCLEYAKTGSIEKARALSNPDLAPHLSFVDTGGHGYSLVKATKSALETEFVCIPRPINDVPGEDGGPIVYRVRHQADIWKKGEAPKLKQKVLEGDPKFSV